VISADRRLPPPNVIGATIECPVVKRAVRGSFVELGKSLLSAGEAFG